MQPASIAAAKAPRHAEPAVPVNASPPDRQVLDAVITMAALVARADGLVVESEREALYRFVVAMSFEPTPSRAEVLDMFDGRIRELRTPGEAIVLERLFARAGDWGSGPIAAVGERVARADGLIDPRERRVMRAIRAMVTVATRAETRPIRALAPSL